MVAGTPFKKTSTETIDGWYHWPYGILTVCHILCLWCWSTVNDEIRTDSNRNGMVNHLIHKNHVEPCWTPEKKTQLKRLQRLQTSMRLHGLLKMLESQQQFTTSSRRLQGCGRLRLDSKLIIETFFPWIKMGFSFHCNESWTVFP